MIRKFISILLNIKGDFQNLFIFNEYDELIGKSKSGIITLSIILTITFLALGYSIGGINYLKEKMDDPFTNWVNLEVKNSYERHIPYIQQEFENDSLRSSYFLNNIRGYRRDFFKFINIYNREVYNKKLRSIDLDDNLLHEILKPANVVSGYSYSSETINDIEQCGLIIKRSTLEDLGYENIEDIIKVPIQLSKDRTEGNLLLYVPIISVVNELPNLVDGLITSHFYRLLIESFEETNFINTANSNRITLVHNSNDRSLIENKLQSVSDSIGIASLDFEYEQLSRTDSLLKVNMYLSRYYSYDDFTDLLKTINEETSMNFEQYTHWECQLRRTYAIEDPYYMSFNFSKLDRVRDFKNYLNDKYGVEISMDQVEQKENFALVSRLTSLISFILFGFSILSIVFYVNSLLRTHLEKIKMNLGTLKAFGLNNKFLIGSYLKIILTFIGISIVIGFLVVSVWDLIEQNVSKQSYFDIFNYKILIAIIVIIVSALITSQRTISKTLLKTPGDLIYNR